MTTLFLIRHAQAEGNLYRIAQGQFDSYITALGYKQIDALAERFKNVHLDALYSSDLRRTRTTATENLSKAELKKAESKKRIAILNNNTNFYPPHNVHQLTMQSHPRRN